MKKRRQDKQAQAQIHEQIESNRQHTAFINIYVDVTATSIHPQFQYLHHIYISYLWNNRALYYNLYHAHSYILLLCCRDRQSRLHFISNFSVLLFSIYSSSLYVWFAFLFVFLFIIINIHCSDRLKWNKRGWVPIARPFARELCVYGYYE